jgi:hypothetical protein
MKKTNFLFVLLLVLNLIANAQSSPFEIYIEPQTIAGLNGIQSYAYAQHDGKWLIVGGRIDGLHRRQPFASFDVAGLNTNVIVIDPNSNQHWSAPLNSLSQSLQDQLSSTNMQFYQQDSMLYFVGGYGHSVQTGTKITYNKLTAIHVPNVINAVINGGALVNHFRQITDIEFAVTGGHLHKIYNTYYLVGGQKFDGNYNPMGNPTYTQAYTNQIRKFTLADDGTNISINHLPSFTDATNLHRRDYNVSPQILPNGQEGLTAFSGVFQTTADIPFLNCVNIDSANYAVNNAFAQYYNHYHCAFLPIYSATNNEMHTVFFGGIAQYYDSLGILVQDNNVPFVKTIARVTRDQNGNMAEFKLPVEMPAFLGASSEFISNTDMPAYPNTVLHLDNLPNDTNLVGYIFGGINSSAANIFWINTGTESTASATIYKVYLVKNTSVGIDQLNAQSNGSLHMQVYPNPNDGNLMLKFNLNTKEKVKLSVVDMEGKIVLHENISQVNIGENLITRKIEALKNGAVYMVTIQTSREKSTQKIIINP